MSKAGLHRFLGAWAYGLLWNLNNASSLPAYSFRIVKAEEARKILRKKSKIKMIEVLPDIRGKTYL